jgi:ABC-type multidrug transport system ATPase subunit
MEEAEVCCQRIGIMAKGKLRCIGSPTRLKHLYGCGYKLSIHSDYLDDAERFIFSILPVGSTRLHSFRASRRYGFAPDAFQLSHVFDQLSTHASLHGIKSWGISQTTLDEIFTSVISEEDASGY